MTWRKEPPTHAEVRDVSAFWWYRTTDGIPHVLHLEASTRDETIIDVEAQAANDCGGVFDPDDWPGEWSPDLPPLSDVKAMTAEEMVAPHVDAMRVSSRITALAMVPATAAAVISYTWFPASAIAPFTMLVGTLSGWIIARVLGRRL